MVHDDLQQNPAGDESDRSAADHATGDVTLILSRIEQGEPQAAEQLLPLVYEELRKLAAAKMAQEKPDQTLQATALVHEAYIRLVDRTAPQRWDNRRHFFAAAAEAMRRILVEQARRKSARKAGGHLERVDLDEVEPVCPDGEYDLLALDEALSRLEQIDARLAELVKLRYFSGLSIPNAAKVLGIAASTAITDWAFARGWLRLELSKG